MFLMKIGKQKRKFTLTIRLRRITYPDLSSLPVDSYFKILAQRGSHDIQFIAQIYKRKDIKCPKQQHKIPLTMYYDNSDKKYLQKQMTLKGYIMNNMQQISKQLGNIDLNLSEYIDQMGQKMQLQLYLYDKYKKKSVVYVYMQFVREDDDNKDIQTSQTQTIKSGKQRKQSLDKNNVLKTGGNSSKVPSQNDKKTEKSDKYGSQRSSVSKFNQKQFQFKYQSTKNPSKQPQKTPISTKQSPFIYNFDQKPTTSSKYQQSTPKKGNLFTDNKQKNNQNNLNNDSIDTHKQNVNYTSNTSRQQLNIPKFKPKKDKQSNNQPSKQQESAQLKVYILQRKLREQQKQLNKSETQIKDQQNLINALLQQKNKALGSYQVRKYTQEIDSLKKQLLQSNIRISELETLNRGYEQNHIQNLSVIEKTTKQLTYYKQLAYHEKIKMASIMQKCLEEGDNDLIEFIEENILDDNID